VSTGYVSGGERVTRKPHPCNFCDATIPVGTLARWWVWSEDGVATTCYGHPRCQSLWERLDVWDEALMDPADFRDACEETFGEEAPFPWQAEAE